MRSNPDAIGPPCRVFCQFAATLMQLGPHVEEGLQPGQLGMRGLLRPPEERVLLPSGLEGRRHGVVHGATGRVHPLLQRAPQEAVARLDEPHAVPDKQGTSRLGWSKELSAPPAEVVKTAAICKFDTSEYAPQRALPPSQGSPDSPAFLSDLTHLGFCKSGPSLKEL